MYNYGLSLNVKGGVDAPEYTSMVMIMYLNVTGGVAIPQCTWIYLNGDDVPEWYWGCWCIWMLRRNVQTNRGGGADQQSATGKLLSKLWVQLSGNTSRQNAEVVHVDQQSTCNLENSQANWLITRMSKIIWQYLELPLWGIALHYIYSKYSIFISYFILDYMTYNDKFYT